DESIDGKKIKFEVIDTGIGIDSSKIDTVFESFVQENSSVRRKFGGTGLGLSIAKEIVDLMGGDISVTSQKGIGSVFSFELPILVSDIGKNLKSYIHYDLNGKEVLLIDRDVVSGQNAKNIIEEYKGKVRWLKGSEGFEDLYKIMSDEKYTKILLDASTLASNLEAFFGHLKERRFDMN